MNNTPVYYSVGPLLYSPANHPTVAESVIEEKFDRPFSLALCLEDTIADEFVSQAEEILKRTLLSIRTAFETTSAEGRPFYLPKIFIRVRSPQQMLRLAAELGSSMTVVAGFIFPKFSLSNADAYLQAFAALQAGSPKKLYLMPILESGDLLDLRTRYDALYIIKEKLKPLESHVLNIRVGGNDLCNIFGFRRKVTESIHRIHPVANLLSDIVTVFGTDYVVSGPVWEYFNGPRWEEGLLAEIAEDQLCGFVGKTVIHPRQIAVVNRAYQVAPSDYHAAKNMLNWDQNSTTLVAVDNTGARMDERKTHENWARRILFLAQAYGICDTQS